MDKFKEIRPIVIGLVVKDGKTLAMQGFDKLKQQEYYRPLGGGVEFLETLEESLKREFKEELDVDIKINEYLGFADNIFNYEGKDAHEHVFIYSIDFENEYLNEYVFYEGDISHKAVWVDIDDIKSGKKIIYPELVVNYL